MTSKASAEAAAAAAAVAAVAPVAAVSIKLPVWWPESAALWFAQAEAQFELRHITDQRTKYFHVMSALDNSTVSRLEDLVLNPPADAYDALKERLIACFVLSSYQRMERLFSMSGLGDRRPSALMDELLSLSSGLEIGKDVVKYLFLSKMSEPVRTAMIAYDFSNTRAAAQRADQVWSVQSKHSNVCQVSPEADPLPPPPSPSHFSTQPTLQSVSATPSTFQSNSATPRNVNVKKRQNSRNWNSNSVRPGASNPRSWEEGLCSCHRKYGHDAFRCVQPCSWPARQGNGQAGRFN